MIPKKIHYTRIWWNPMPEMAVKCVESWKQKLPEYELCLWNETNFDFDICMYVRQAYDAKKFAFVWDYVRIRAMYNYGWISMDTDVEVLRSINQFLCHKWFSWFESKDIIPTWIMWFEKWHPLLKRLLDYYNTASFLDENNSPKLIANTLLITEIAKDERKFQWGKNEHLILWDDFHIYPESYFCPKDDYQKLLRDKNVFTIHYFAGSRLTKRDQNRRKFMKLIIWFCKKIWVYWKVSLWRRKYFLKSA